MGIRGDWSIPDAPGRATACFHEPRPFLLETSVPGIFAAGYVRDASIKQLVCAAGEGGTAALEIREFLKHAQRAGSSEVIPMEKKKKNSWLGKAAVVAVLVLGIVVFRYFELGQYLSLDYLKGSQEKFRQLYQSHRIAVIAAYMGIYVAVTALSLPGAAVLTLAGGGLFGLVVGTVTVSFASTIGATLACVVSRFLLRDWVQNKFGDKLTTINAGIEKEGAFYLFSLRLVPVFPFFIINLLMGLTRIRLLTFFWVSQIGMLAGTVVYVNAGRQLAQIDSLAGILSPGVVISFVVLGLFPIAVKKLLALYKRKFGKNSSSGGV